MLSFSVILISAFQVLRIGRMPFRIALFLFITSALVFHVDFVAVQNVWFHRVKGMVLPCKTIPFALQYVWFGKAGGTAFVCLLLVEGKQDGDGG